MEIALDLTAKSSPVLPLGPTPLSIGDHYDTPSPSPPVPSYRGASLADEVHASVSRGASVFPGSPDVGDLSLGHASSPNVVGASVDGDGGTPIGSMNAASGDLLAVLSGNAALLATARQIMSERQRHQHLFNQQQQTIARKSFAKRPRLVDIGTPIRSLDTPTPPPTDNEDSAAYWERRRRNNQAAKRSRDSRRAKEEGLAVRAAVLERDNIELRAQVDALRAQTSKLHAMLYNDGAAECASCPGLGVNETAVLDTSTPHRDVPPMTLDLPAAIGEVVGGVAA